MSEPDLSESDNPLLNDYKLHYVLKLLLQTFIGGVRLRFEHKVPLYIYYVQIIIWILPFLIGLIFTLLVEVSKNEEQLMALVYGAVMLVFHIMLQLIGFVLKQRLVAQPITTQNFLADEDEVTFVSFLSHSTFEFLIPKKKLIINYLFHPLLCGVVCSFSFLFLIPKRTETIFSSTAGCWVYLIIGSIVVCIACYPLIGQLGKDPAAYRVIDSWELLPISKSCYVLAFGVVSYVGRSSLPATTFPSLDLTIHILFLFFPFFWLFGLLPPLDALLSWCCEQILIHILGGSMMATDGRLLTMLVLSATSVAVIFFIPIKIIAVIVLASLSFLISLDVCTITVNFCNKLTTFGLHRLKNDKKSVTKSSCKDTLWFLFYLLFMLTFANIIVVLTELYMTNTQQFSYNFNILAGVLFFVTILNKMLCSLQHVYIFFSILRNPLYTKVCEKYTRMWFIKKTSSVIRLIVLPLCLLLVVSMVLLAQNTTLLSSVFSCILVFRVYRMIWQDTSRCCNDVLLYSILIWADFDSWNSVDPSVHLFIVSLFLYFVTSFFKNIWFMFLLAYNSPTKSAKERKKVKSAIMITICAAPITIAIVVLATITSSSLLPLFTLPLYLVGFMRPQRIWPQASSSTKSSSKDWVYYKQLLPSLASEIKRQFLAGGLNSLNAGDFFLARFQDRIIWVSVLESGFTHCNFVIKGLELQETSCHTIEAEYVDNIFSRSFDSTITETKNEYFTSVLTPKFSFHVDTYSDARNVLTGIIDNPETLKSVSNFFPKVLLWVLTRYCLHRRKMGLKDTKCTRSQQIELGDCFTPQNENSLLTTRTKESRLDDMIIPNMPFVKHNEKDDDIICETNLNDSPISSNKELILTPMTNLVEPIRSEVKPPIFVKPIKIGNKPDNESDDEFGDFGFSDEDFPSGTEQSSDEDDIEDAELQNPVALNIGVNTTDYHAVSNVAKVVDPPCYWKQKLPFTENELSTYSSLISRDWYESVINSLNLTDGKLILEDSVLFKCYKHLVLTCFYIVDVAGVLENSSLKEGPGHVLKMFYGMLPWSPHSGWLEEDDELKELVVQSYRYAFKLALDNNVLGEISDNDEMLSMLTEYEEQWFIGEEDSERWMQNVLEEKPYLLSIFQDRRKSNIYTSRLLSKQLLEVTMAQVNAECVRGFWSALCLELYYMTNDDDERYSIQALPSLIRNIITQAADPPLGYPVYSSGLISVHL